VSAIIPFLLACGIIAAVSVPLILRAVPPNPWYGLRTKQTLSDRELWFSANYFAGWAFLVAALVSAAILIAMPEITPTYRALVLLAPVCVALAISLVYANKIKTAKRKP
jgi:uncharacterized membrane protein